jgi:hypothetical protein
MGVGGQKKSESRTVGLESHDQNEALKSVIPVAGVLWLKYNWLFVPVGYTSKESINHRSKILEKNCIYIEHTHFFSYHYFLDNIV